MAEDSVRAEQRFFAPEVIQTSAMDCGPAALKCLLEGFGIPVSYGRLREVCQTDVDGTSIDTLEDVAQQLGLAAEQLLAPVDHLLTPSSHLLPALVVVRLPDGAPHFVIVWRVVGPFVQIMDPATGRRWVRRRHFLRDIYRHALPFPATEWRTWAGDPGFCAPVRQRLERLHLPTATINQLLTTALADPHWYALAVLDAATRFVETLTASGGVTRGAEATQLLTTLLAQVGGDERRATALIPSPFWFVQRLLAPGSQGTSTDEQLLLRGAVLIRVRGRRLPTQSAATDPMSSMPPAESGRLRLSPAMVAALTERPSRPEWEVLRVLGADGWLTPTVLLGATTVAAVSVTLEALLLRGLLNLAEPFALASAHTVFFGISLFTVLLLCLESPITETILRMGRRLELRLRMTLLQKLPRLGDQYFRSRLISDLATRAHGLHHLHALPDLAQRTLRLAIQLLLTAGGIIWLYPASAPLALLATGTAIAMAGLTQPLLAERDMRVRTHGGGLSRFYLDALLGLTPIRTHSAARAVRREHEMRLTAWARAQLDFQSLQRVIQLLVALLGLGFAIAIVLNFLATGGEASGVLLLLYWALALPTLGQSLVNTIQQYPLQRNHLIRLLEPLGAPDEDETVQAEEQSTADLAPSAPAPGVAIQMAQITVRAGDQIILADLDLTVAAGEHVAIVGASGAGKSTLVGLLLGWQRPVAGTLTIDGLPLTGDRLAALRQQTAWVDPAVQLWNRTLLENLAYGLPPHDRNGPAAGQDARGMDAEPNWAAVWDAANLYPVLDLLPGGLHAPLGESGGLVSGGEGQRVRLGRALLRPQVRLAILDEPFRGLDRQQRHQLLRNARHHWRHATLLCATHDIGMTQDFDRVLVIAHGRLVEAGSPAALAAQPDSHYRALLEAEAAVQHTLWGGTSWRRLWLAEGNLAELAVDRATGK